MDFHILLDTAAEVGYRLAMSGAETFRVEESINRILQSYGIRSEVFSIPNYLHVSIFTPDGQSLTRMRRIGEHGNDLDAVERYSALSRRICAQRPSPAEAARWLRQTDDARLHYSFPLFLLGNFLGAFGFSILFGSRLSDAFCSGFCGLLVGLINRWMDSLRANQFFRLIAASFLMAFTAYGLNRLELCQKPDAVIIGALMILVPGLLFTNAMRDIIFGDINSGTNRIVQVFLIAVALALGTGAALSVATLCFGAPDITPAVAHSLLWETVASCIGVIGFCFIFNIHGPGLLLCALGGIVTWVIYSLVQRLGLAELPAYFIGSVWSALYSEIMARIRKYPAISYLVTALFPLIPGAGIYYTMNHAVQGDMDAFTNQGMFTLSIAGTMAVAILMVSTAFRMYSIRKHR